MIELVEEALNKLKPLIADFVVEPINFNGSFTIKNEFKIIPPANGRAAEPDKHKELIKLVVDAVNDFMTKMALPSASDDEKVTKETKCRIAFNMFDEALTNFKLSEPYLPGEHWWSGYASSELQIQLSKLHVQLKSAKRGIEVANAAVLSKLQAEQKQSKLDRERERAENAKLQEDLAKALAEVTLLRTKVPSSAFTTPRNSPPGKKPLRENNQQTLFAEPKPAAAKPGQAKNDIEYLTTYFGDTQAKVLCILFRFSQIPQLAKLALDAYVNRIINYTKPLAQNFADQFRLPNINVQGYSALLQELTGLIQSDNQPGKHEADMAAIHARNANTLKANPHLTNEYVILDRYKKFLVRPNKFCPFAKEYAPEIPNILNILSDEMANRTNVNDELARQQNCKDAQALRRSLRETIAINDKEMFGQIANGVVPVAPPVNGM